MNWLAHLHDWRALEVAWAATAVPLWVGLLQERPPLTKWLRSPITATVCLVMAAIVAGALRWLLGKVGISDASTTATLASLCRRSPPRAGGYTRSATL